MTLADRKCVPCRGGVPPLETPIARKLLEELGPGWQLTHGTKRLEKTYKFGEFADALRFVNRVGEIAEKEDHHPDLRFGWGYCTLEIWSHKIDGLTESDFYLAAKADREYRPPPAA